MKIVNYNNNRFGLLDDQRIIDISDKAGGSGFMGVFAWLQKLTPSEREQLKAASDALPLAAVKLNSPVPLPGKVVAAPVNYKAHIEEMSQNGQAFGHVITDIRKAGMFLKAPSSVVGAAHGVMQRFLDRRTDHEIELCAVIGRAADRVSAKDALGCVAGYCIGLDMTVRGPEDRSFRKSVDSYTVLGPWITTADEGIDPTNIDLELTVNGKVCQATNTSDMVLGMAELIEYASSFYTLQPGDILMSGTPQGVGPVRPGDIMVAKGTGLGSMTVAVSAA
jgi:2-keto-4-pentenoate hydratase/2-oxohepta-3-ene-1,7-dioic acid hydratase in catechol pathway